jgi:hypothetical protein
LSQALTGVVEMFRKTLAFLSFQISQLINIRCHGLPSLPIVVYHFTPLLFDIPHDTPLSWLNVMETQPILQGVPNSNGEAAFK